MAFWNRKPKTQEEPKPIVIPCRHKYRDFQWYIENKVYNSGNWEIQIIEPYVCVHCGDRKNQLLTEISGHGRDKLAQNMARLREIYGENIQPRAFIENEISDMQLVDRDYLRALAVIRPGALTGMDENAEIILKRS